MNDEVRFDRGPAGQRCRFRDPHEVIRADAPEDLPAAFAAITRAQADGRWLAVTVDATGRFEIVIQRLGGDGQRQSGSIDGG